MANLQEEAASAASTLANTLDEASNYENPNLSEQGLQRKRGEMSEEARSTAKAQIRDIHQRATAAAQAAETRAAADLKSDDSTRDEWDRVKMILDAGKTLPEILADADMHRVLAIREWGGAYLEADYAKTGVPVERLRSALDTSTLERLSAVTNSEAIASLIDSKRSLAKVTEFRSRVDEVAVGGTDFTPTRRLGMGYTQSPDSLRPDRLEDLPALESKS